jgi:hypothetical protein
MGVTIAPAFVLVAVDARESTRFSFPAGTWQAGTRNKTLINVLRKAPI